MQKSKPLRVTAGAFGRVYAVASAVTEACFRAKDYMPRKVRMFSFISTIAE